MEEELVIQSQINETGDELFDEAYKSVEEEEEDQLADPVDKYNIVYLIFFFYGFGLLIVWNVLLSCFDYLII